MPPHDAADGPARHLTLDEARAEGRDAQAAPGQGLRIDQVERGLFERLLQLGLSLLTAHVAAHGDGDVGDTATAPDGQTCRKLPDPHDRIYRSVFGPGERPNKAPEPTPTSVTPPANERRIE